MPAETPDQVSARVAGAIPKKARTPKNGNGTAEADHFELANAWITSETRRTGREPVYALGSFWIVEHNLWRPLTVDRVAIEVARKFAGAKLCRRGGDFNAIARIAAQLSADDDFFAQAPAGVAGPEMFWTVTEAGEIKPEPLTPEHRQRMRVAADPDFTTEAKRFDALLDHAFGTDPEGLEQRRLLQVVFGAAIARMLWRQRIAVLLLGTTSTGKSTLLNILSAMFPDDQVGATSPQKWANEYYVAGLAGKAINVVGELEPNTPIPGGAFKTVTGRDVIEGRHPTHRPFSFVCQASHFFNANRPPPTTDRSDAFFRRWRILHFTNTVAEADEIGQLDEIIVRDEIGAVLGWMLQGAATLAREGRVPESAAHRRLLAQWRHANNSVLQFLLDPAACEVFPGHEAAGAVLYAKYVQWCKEAGVKSFGRNNFYEAIDEAAGRHGIHRRDGHDGVVVVGVSTL